MNTNIPIPSRKHRHALTILEMLVSVALLSFIILGLTAMFVQTQKAFKMGIKQSEVSDSGRTVIEMIAADLSQLGDNGLNNTNGLGLGLNTAFQFPNLNWYASLLPLVQSNSDNGVSIPFRTNQIEFFSVMVQTNNIWEYIGYSVSNWFTNTIGGTTPGVGTLYRYLAQTNMPLTELKFRNMALNINRSNYHRIADGIVHLKIYAYDADGNETYGEQLFDSNVNPSPNYMQYPRVVTNNFGGIQTNYLPHSIDIELGVLEPEAIEHARSLFAAGATAAAATFLQQAGGQVQIYRQHIIIPAAP